MQKRLMILGAGPGQLPIIRKAVDLGLYVITVDYLPENVGHEFSHQYVNCSTVDKEGVLGAARELNIDGIATFASDVATPTVGFVAEQIELPGSCASIAQTMSNKAKFRTFQREHGLNSPNFVIGECLEDIEEQIEALSPPLMFKPVDTSGSRGISKLDKIDHDRCALAFQYAQGYSPSKTVCVEEFVDGIDVSGDGFLLNGRLYAVITHKHKNGYIPKGHSLPTNIPDEDQERVFAEVVANCRAVGYTDGPLDFDVRVSPSRITVLEMSPRLGGNGIPMIIERATGVDLITATVRFALGEDVELPSKLRVVMRCGSWIFGSDHAGRLEGISTEEELRVAVPQVFECMINYRVGDKVPRFVHSGNSLGHVLFDCPSQSSYRQIVDRLQGALRLKVAPVQ
jgi:biotin carboxylase